MILLVSCATATLKPLLANPHLGLHITPRSGNSIDWTVPTGKPWAADNDAFVRFDAPALCRMLGRIAGKSECPFVACPFSLAMTHSTTFRIRNSDMKP